MIRWIREDGQEIMVAPDDLAELLGLALAGFRVAESHIDWEQVSGEFWEQRHQAWRRTEALLKELRAWVGS